MKTEISEAALRQVTCLYLLDRGRCRNHHHPSAGIGDLALRSHSSRHEPPETPNVKPRTKGTTDNRIHSQFRQISHHFPPISSSSSSSSRQTTRDCCAWRRCTITPIPILILHYDAFPITPRFTPPRSRIT